MIKIGSLICGVGCTVGLISTLFTQFQSTGDFLLATTMFMGGIIASVIPMFIHK